MKNKDIEATEAHKDRLVGRTLFWLEVFMENRDGSDFSLKEMRVVCKGVGRFVVMLKGVDAEGRQHVSWHDGSDVRGAVLGALNRYRNNELRWWPDKYQKGFTDE